MINVEGSFRPGGKYVWNSRERMFRAKRVDSGVYSTDMYYRLIVGEDWVKIYHYELDDLIQLLQEIKADAEGRKT